MIVALIIGRKNSKRLPNKNIMVVGGKKLCKYSMIAAKESLFINEIYTGTDCPEIESITREMDISLIKIPSFLTTDESLVEDVVFYCLQEIEKILGEIEIIVLLFANVATITGKELDSGINLLKINIYADSVVSVREEERYPAARAKAIKNGYIVGIENQTNSQDYKYFYNGCFWITKAATIKKMEGLPRFRWLGNKVIPFIQEFGLDINYDYEVLLTEFWLEKQKNKKLDNIPIAVNRRYPTHKS